METNPDTSETKTDDGSLHPFAAYLPEWDVADFPPIHPVANIFPMLELRELQAWAESIKANGQQVAIVMLQGKILDGRNRWVACQLAGVKPRMENGDHITDPLTFVITQNLERRHLDTVQRSLIAERIATAKHGGNQRGDCPTLEQAADKMKTSRTSVATTRKIRTKAPKVHEDMAKGKYKSVNAAAKAAGLTKSKGPKASRSAEIPTENKSENDIVRQLSAGEIPAEIGPNLHFCLFDELKTFGAVSPDTSKIERVVQALWAGVTTRFQNGLREIFPRYVTFNSYGKPWAQTGELFKPNSPNAEKAQKHVKETLVPRLETYLKETNNKFGPVHVCEIHQMMNEEYRRFAEFDPRNIPFKSKDSKPKESEPEAESTDPR
jgi:hypothetical protein